MCCVRVRVLAIPLVLIIQLFAKIVAGAVGGVVSCRAMLRGAAKAETSKFSGEGSQCPFLVVQGEATEGFDAFAHGGVEVLKGSGVDTMRYYPGRVN